MYFHTYFNYRNFLRVYLYTQGQLSARFAGLHAVCFHSLLFIGF